MVKVGSEVQVVEFLDHITPGMDKEISNEFQKLLKKQGINFNLKTKVDSISKNKNGVTVNTTDEQGNKKQFDCDVVLISVGRKPNTSNLNLEKVGVDKDNKGRVKLINIFKQILKTFMQLEMLSRVLC